MRCQNAVRMNGSTSVAMHANAPATTEKIRGVHVHVMSLVNARANKDSTETKSKNVCHMMTVNMTSWKSLLFHQKPKIDQRLQLSLHNFIG
ncbi:hypothetical protein ANCDUO_16670 [Ancylostoma duodenale]|uniref:Uncharacterized protein n=1 Tax=Ancylostoma duodenale TaxID=51022 RepID=A0A0C2FXB3_9BILA|nr:hypothetical protein ANCDUO_16670 [Ancylostoma duodenale]